MVASMVALNDTVVSVATAISTATIAITTGYDDPKSIREKMMLYVTLMWLFENAKRLSKSVKATANSYTRIKKE